MRRKEFYQIVVLAIALIALSFGYIILAKKAYTHFIKTTQETTKTTTELTYLGQHSVTFYCSNVCTGKCKTATGTVPVPRKTVAVDPSFISLGSKLHVEGFGLLIAEDTGADIKGKRLDIFVESCQEARQLGRQMLEAYLINESKESTWKQ